MRFTSDETTENLALRAILQEIRSDLNDLKSGLGTLYANAILAADPRKSPLGLSFEASDIAATKTGSVNVTTVWGTVTTPGATELDPPTVEGYFAELLWDLSVSDIDEEQVKRRIAKRWNDFPDDAPVGNDWKTRFDGLRKAVGDVSYWTEVANPVHGFYGVDELEAEAQPVADLERRRTEREALLAPAGNGNGNGNGRPA